jgi:hypothetical protein
MLQRCYNPNHIEYKRYGGRGIGVCDEWRNDPESFLAWAKETGYRHTGGKRNEMSIDRIDNNLGYSPQNCKWSTPEEQNRNMRSNRWLTIGGETKIWSDWARDERCVVPPQTFYGRLYRGWEAVEALSAPGLRLSEQAWGRVKWRLRVRYRSEWSPAP